MATRKREQNAYVQLSGSHEQFRVGFIIASIVIEATVLLKIKSFRSSAPSAA